MIRFVLGAVCLSVIAGCSQPNKLSNPVVGGAPALTSVAQGGRGAAIAQAILARDELSLVHLTRSSCKEAEQALLDLILLLLDVRYEYPKKDIHFGPNLHLALAYYRLALLEEYIGSDQDAVRAHSLANIFFDASGVGKSESPYELSELHRLQIESYGGKIQCTGGSHG